MSKNNGNLSKKKFNKNLENLLLLSKVKEENINRISRELSNVLVEEKPLTNQGLGKNIQEDGFRTSTLEHIGKAVNYILNNYSLNIEESEFEEISKKYGFIQDNFIKEYYEVKQKYNGASFIKFWEKYNIKSRDFKMKNKVLGAYYDLILRNIDLCEVTEEK